MLTDGRTDGLMDGRTENRTPISHPATSRCDNNRALTMDLIDRVEVLQPSQPIRAMSRQSIHLTTLFLGRLSPLSSKPLLIYILLPETDNSPS